MLMKSLTIHSNPIAITITVFLLLTSSNTLLSQEIPEIDSVSINLETGNPVIGWHIANYSEIDGFFVIRLIIKHQGIIDYTYHIIAEIDDPSQTWFEDNTNALGIALPNEHPEVYRLASYKIIEGKKEYNLMCDPHETIFLYPIEYETCQTENELRWTQYKGWNDGLKAYDIYYRSNATDAPLLLGSTANSDTTFVHSGFTNNQKHIYFIRARHKNGVSSSTSNQVEIETQVPPPPQILNADFVNVESNSVATISFTVEPTTAVKNYLVLRTGTPNSNFDTIASYEANATNITYTDHFDTKTKVYYYKVVAKNICNHVVAQSNVVHNLKLASYSTETVPPNNILRWDEYTGWDGRVSQYNIYRYNNSGAIERITEIVAGQSNYEYTDRIGDLSAEELQAISFEGSYCYMIEAVENGSNPFGVKGVSRSNRSCVAEASIIYVPNAFNPKSDIEQNREFKPALSYATDYILIIYSRWGNKIFESTEYLIGWDGTDSTKKIVPQGSYIYYLKYTNSNNEIIEKGGYVSVMYSMH